MLASCRNECTTGVKAGHVTGSDRASFSLWQHTKTWIAIQTTAERQSVEKTNAFILRKRRAGHNACGVSHDHAPGEETCLETSNDPGAKFSRTAAPRIPGKVTMACGSECAQAMRMHVGVDR